MDSTNGYVQRYGPDDYFAPSGEARLDWCLVCGTALLLRGDDLAEPDCGLHEL